MDFAIADLEKNKKALAEKQALFLCIIDEIATPLFRFTAPRF